MMNPGEVWRRGKIPCWECRGCGWRSGVEVVYCAKCHSKDIHLIELDGTGKVISFTVITVPEERYLKEVPYAYCIVEGDGFRFCGWVGRDDLKDLTIGSKVRSVSHDGYGLRLKPLR